MVFAVRCALIFLVALAAALLSSPGWAQEACFAWRASCSSGAVQGYSIAGIAEDIFVGTGGACGGGAGLEVTGIDSCTAAGAPTALGQTASCTVHYRLYAGGSIFDMPVSASSVSADCPPPAGCDTGAPEIGKTFSGTASSMATRSYCHAVNNCLVSVKQSVSSSGGAIYTGTVTSQDCPSDGSAPSVAADDLSEGEGCVAVGDGSYCAAPKAGDGSCGYLNDSFVCLNKVTPDECKPLGDGGAVCGSSAGTPPVPDTGTRGEPATPSGSIEQQTGSVSNTYNYYNSSTVSSSSVATGDGSNPQDSGGSPSGNGKGEGLPDGGECEGADCTPSMPTLEEVGTLREAAAGFWGRLQDVPIVAAVSEIGDSVPVAQAPEWSTTISVFGESMEIDFGIVAELWDSISPLLSTAALAMWGLLAVRVFLSA